MNRLIDHAINAAVTVVAVATDWVAELWSPTPYDRVERAYNDLLDAAEDACWGLVGVDHQASAPAESESECICWTDPATWTYYYGAAEPGSQCEWDPDCPVHGTQTSTPPSTSDGEGPEDVSDIPPSPPVGRPTQ